MDIEDIINKYTDDKKLQKKIRREIIQYNLGLDRLEEMNIELDIDDNKSTSTDSLFVRFLKTKVMAQHLLNLYHNYQYFHGMSADIIFSDFAELKGSDQYLMKDREPSEDIVIRFSIEYIVLFHLLANRKNEQSTEAEALLDSPVINRSDMPRNNIMKKIKFRPKTEVITLNRTSCIYCDCKILPGVTQCPICEAMVNDDADPPNDATTHNTFKIVPNTQSHSAAKFHSVDNNLLNKKRKRTSIELVQMSEWKCVYCDDINDINVENCNTCNAPADDFKRSNSKTNVAAEQETILENSHALDMTLNEDMEMDASSDVSLTKEDNDRNDPPPNEDDIGDNETYIKEGIVSDPPITDDIVPSNMSQTTKSFEAHKNVNESDMLTDDTDNSWVCSSCTYINTDKYSQNCIFCYTLRIVNPKIELLKTDLFPKITEKESNPNITNDVKMTENGYHPKHHSRNEPRIRGGANGDIETPSKGMTKGMTVDNESRFHTTINTKDDKDSGEVKKTILVPKLYIYQNNKVQSKHNQNSAPILVRSVPSKDDTARSMSYDLDNNLSNCSSIDFISVKPFGDNSNQRTDDKKLRHPILPDERKQPNKPTYKISSTFNHNDEERCHTKEGILKKTENRSLGKSKENINQDTRRIARSANDSNSTETSYLESSDSDVSKEKEPTNVLKPRARQYEKNPSKNVPKTTLTSPKSLENVNEGYETENQTLQIKDLPSVPPRNTKVRTSPSPQTYNLATKITQQQNSLQKHLSNTDVNKNSASGTPNKRSNQVPVQGPSNVNQANNRRVSESPSMPLMRNNPQPKRPIRISLFSCFKRSNNDSIMCTCEKEQGRSKYENLCKECFQRKHQCECKQRQGKKKYDGMCKQCYDKKHQCQCTKYRAEKKYNNMCKKCFKKYNSSR